MSALALWWGNPVTAVLGAAALLAALALALTGMVAVLRLGPVQLVGLLAQRPSLLPGVPRRPDAHTALVVFLTGVAGVALALEALVAVRAGRLLGAAPAALAVALVVAWFAALAAALALARGGRVERIAAATLVAARPSAPLLRRLADAEESAEPVPAGADQVDEHEVQAFIGVGEEAGILEKEDAELVASIVELSETVAREIMTPRTDVVAIPVDAEFAEVERQFADSMFTRLPVFRETYDHIEGVVHVKDALRAVANGATPTARELLRPVLVVPETKPLRELLREFQASRQQMALVVDEYGGTAGMVTLEDVLEEIVGEIQDEHQREAPAVAKEAEGVYLLDGGANVEVLSDLFGVPIGDVGFDSVAGLVLDRLGHLPRVGERAAWDGLDLEVVEADRRRVRRVRVRRQADAPA